MRHSPYICRNIPTETGSLASKNKLNFYLYKFEIPFEQRKRRLFKSIAIFQKWYIEFATPNLLISILNDFDNRLLFDLCVLTARAN